MFIRMKSFLNYFTSKMIVQLLCKCHNLCKYFVSQNTVIPRNDTFLYYETNQISIKRMRKFYEIFFLRIFLIYFSSISDELKLEIEE